MNRISSPNKGNLWNAIPKASNSILELDSCHPKYRPDIDGLRAIAVMSVVLFHAFPKLVRGGFVGVDIFFVISGFLISSIIFTSLENGKFSFIDFYSRRICRIFPALALVLIASLVVGWFVLLAEEYRQLGKHVAGGAAFVSNLILWGESGYFDNDAEAKPLLHLWSLGIEEQFYILWPVILWVSWKMRFNLLGFGVLVGLLSFAINYSSYRSDMVANFYSPFSRFWELMAGALLAYGMTGNSPLLTNIRSKSGYLHLVLGVFDDKYKNFRSVFGLFLIVFAIFVTKQKHFPGMWALLPVLGTVFMISAGPFAVANRNVLSNRILVWLGLISFPLYLWHWPILSFTRIVEGATTSESLRVSAILLALLLAVFTYFLVEKPVRFGGKPTKKTILLFVFISILGCVGYFSYRADGLPSRLAAAPTDMLDGDVGHLTYHRYLAEKYFPCTPESIYSKALQWDGYVRCMQSKEDREVDIALVGDSHAEHLFISFAEQLPERNIAYYIRNQPAFIGSKEFFAIYEHVLSSKSIKTVILTMQWIKRQKQLPAGSSLDQELLETVQELLRSGKEVYITDDVPEFPFDSMKCKLQRANFSSRQCEMDRSNFDKVTAEYWGAIDHVLRVEPRLKLIEISKFFCADRQCRMSQGRDVLYRDRHHLNIVGSKYLGDKISPSIQSLRDVHD